MTHRDLASTPRDEPTSDPVRHWIRSLIVRHLAKVESDHDSTLPSVRAVVPMWRELGTGQLLEFAVTRLLDLCPTAVQQGKLAHAAERVGNVVLLTSVVSCAAAEQIRERFASEGYLGFTQRVAFQGTIPKSTWLAHWTLGVEADKSTGELRATIHLSVIPSIDARESGAMILFARDLIEPDVWKRLHGSSAGKQPSDASSMSDLSEALRRLMDQVGEAGVGWADAIELVRNLGGTAWNDQGLREFVRSESEKHDTSFIGAFQFRALVFWATADVDRLSDAMRWDIGMTALREIRSDTPPAWLNEAAIGIVERLQLIRSAFSPTVDSIIELQLLSGGLLLHRQCGDARNNLDRAERAFLQTVDMVDRNRNLPQWILLQNGLGLVYRARCELGDDSSALPAGIDCFRNVLESIHPHQWSQLRAATQFNLAGLLVQVIGPDRGNALREAERLCQQALAVQTQAHSPLEWSMNQHLLGIISLRRPDGDHANNVERAIQYFDEAANCPQRRAQPRLLARTLNCLGNAWNNRLVGDLEENGEQAIACYQEAASYQSQEANPRAGAIAHHNLAVAYQLRRRGERDQNLERAAHFCRRALQVPKSALGSNLLALVNLSLAESMPDSPNARAHLEAAVRLVSRQQKPLIWGAARASLGAYLLFNLRQSRPQEIQQGWDYLLQAREVLTAETAPDLWPKLQMDLGTASQLRLIDSVPADLADPEELFLSAATGFETIGDLPGAVKALNAVGQLRAKLARWNEAAGAWRKGAMLAQQVTTCFEAETSRSRWRASVGRLYGDLASALINESKQSADELQRVSLLQEACVWLDRSQSQTVTELMESRDAGNAAAQSPVHARDVELQHEIYALDRWRDNHWKTSWYVDDVSEDPEAVPVRLATCLRKRKSLQTELQSIRLQLDRPDRETTASSMGQAFSEIQAAARESDAHLLFLRVTAWGTCVLAVTPQGTITGDLVAEVTYATLRRWLVTGIADDGSGWEAAYRRYRNAPADSQEELTCSQQWMRVLDATLAEVGDKLWRQVQHILSNVIPKLEEGSIPPLIGIAPGPGLNMLPLHAAWWRDGEQLHDAADHGIFFNFLGARALLAALARRENAPLELRRLFAICNPRGDLPHADTEVRSVAALFDEVTILTQTSTPPATAIAVKQLLPSCTYALLATHGVYEPAAPWERSGFELVENSRDGLRHPALPLGDIFMLDLSRLNLAVLSSCESGLSAHDDDANEQFGLPAAFCIAGARTVVASLWCIDDAAASVLVERFFRELLMSREGDRAHPAVALWKAVRSLRQQLGTTAFPLGSSPRNLVRRKGSRLTLDTSHPYYWAPFTLFGVP